MEDSRIEYLQMRGAQILHILYTLEAYVWLSGAFARFILRSSESTVAVAFEMRNSNVPPFSSSQRLVPLILVVGACSTFYLPNGSYYRTPALNFGLLRVLRADTDMLRVLTQ